jgi:hypothetical protein
MLLMGFTKCSFLPPMLPGNHPKQAKQASVYLNSSKPNYCELIIRLSNDITTLITSIMRFLEIIFMHANISI